MRGIAAMVALALCPAVAVGCGGSSDPSNATKAADNEPGPALEVPGGPLPRKLVVKDLTVGHGPPAKDGDRVTIQYKGKLWSGDPYSDSWTYQSAPSFIVGGNELIVGFSKGIEGMKAGGRRLLYVPRPEDVFPHTAVTAGSTALAFIVYMLKVRPPH